MDQLKPTLEQMKKHHFWILCGLIVVVYLGTWFMATRSINKEFKSRETALNGMYSNVKSILGKENHPNEHSKKDMEQLNTEQAQMVRAAWETRFKQQAGVLTWPEELRPDFINKVKDLQPIEKLKFPTAPENELRAVYRQRYQNYIKQELPKLASIIDAVWHPSKRTTTSGFGGEGGYDPGGGLGPGDGMLGGPAAGTAQPESVVEWNSGNQITLQEQRFDWTAAPGGAPSTIDILYAQEDLWVLRSLMNVIKNTNGDADARYNAAIKEIIAIDLGNDAPGVRSVGVVSRGDMTSGGSGMEGYGDTSGGGGELGAPSAGAGGAAGMLGMPGEGGYGEGEPERIDPAENRYVDEKYEPLTADRIRNAVESTSPDDASLAVAKRMPVRMRMKMNILKLPQFIAECGNADLTLEIRQVRINTPSGVAGGEGGMAGGAGGFSPAGSGGAGAGMGMGAGAGLGDGDDGGYGDEGGYGNLGGGAAAALSSESPYDAEVEIYGIVYIYNPVDPKKLGLDEQQAAVPVAQPAAGG